MVDYYGPFRRWSILCLAIGKVLHFLTGGANRLPRLTNIRQWRVRSGDYRIILDVYFEQDKAYIVSVQHRREAYR